MEWEGKVGVVYVASEKVGEHRRSLSGRRTPQRSDRLRGRDG